MKTIVSLALAGLMSISALLPTLAAQEAENVSIPESSGISESVAQDESSVSSSGSTADESTEPESGSNTENESDSVPQSESGSTPVEYDSSISEDLETETGSSLPVSESAVPDETESATGSETAADEQSVPVTVSEEYALLLATNQADSMMGHAGMERSDACTQPAASFALTDYAAETEDESYCLLWEAMNAAFEQLGAQRCTAANCVFTDGMIILMR
jgi:hypothetical protein